MAGGGGGGRGAKQQPRARTPGWLELQLFEEEPAHVRVGAEAEGAPGGAEGRSLGLHLCAAQGQRGTTRRGEKQASDRKCYIIKARARSPSRFV